MTRAHDATEAQVRAADPQQSTWLSANAGSGKTRVLTDRVARLLLTGVDPARILCLTYTKAAASEMQNRLFRRLGDWAMLQDTALTAALGDLGLEEDVGPARLASARRLFARAIEVPGGLRIQTIHSFCASLLRRFPLEAGVSPHFSEIDDRGAKLLRAQIVDEMASDLAPGVVADLARSYTGEDFGGLAEEIARRRGTFAKALSDAECHALFDLPEGLGEGDILRDVFLGGECTWLGEVAAALAGGTVTDQKAGVRLGGLGAGPLRLDDLTLLESLLLTGAGAKVPFQARIGAFPTKGLRATLGPLLDPLEALMARVERARTRRVGLAAARRTAVMHRFAAVFLPLYADRKAQRGWLDFDDLIIRARDLLTDPRVAQWVLFRLDGGIDHILVDEAQDTSPEQWTVIEQLSAEFMAGHGARDAERTIFVVGDKKQSIYSFQGADVAVFDAKREDFGRRLSGAGARLQVRELAHSFRSAPAILRLVDQTFGAAGDRGLGGDVHHIAFQEAMPGRIDLWPPIAKAEEPEQAHWYDPVDLVSDTHHAVLLGRRVAAAIRDMIVEGRQIPVKGTDAMRPVAAGDVLILVQRRGDVFAAVIAACKALGLPVAGADRLRLGGELAVRDINALLSFLATPEDDLALASVLKSPLFGWTEAQLYALAHGRKGYLWQILRGCNGHADTRAVLNDLRDRADFLRPYDLIERLLTYHDGRRALIARLGREAEDGIDELLSQALVYEQNDVPSLTGFLGWLGADDVEVKRRTDAAGGRIRVMTVHGAKGLEAPVVILPDTAQRRKQDRGDLILLPGATGGRVPVWKTPTGESPEGIQTARADLAARDAAESLRLLYVAMTRAQSWLIVAAAGDIGADPKGDAPQTVWYRLIRDAMEAIGASTVDGGGLTFSDGNWPAPAPEAARAAPPDAALPDWMDRPAPPRDRPAQPVRPSDLGGAKIVTGDADQVPRDTVIPGAGPATDRGTRLHLLLEHLPGRAEVEWETLAATLLPDAPDREALLAEARGVLTDPALAFLFAPDALAEVAITAPWNGGVLLGAIDRLIVGPGRVLAVDFKSNLVVPGDAADVPEGLLRQMGAYAHALEQVWPGRRVEAALLWTRTPLLMPLDADLVKQALVRAGTA